MGGGLNGRSGRRPSGSAVVGSLGVHAAVAAALWFGGFNAPPPLPEFKVYRVNVVSPPSAERGLPEPVVVNPRQADPPPAEPEPAPPVVETPPRPEPEAHVEQKSPPTPVQAPQEIERKTTPVVEEPKPEPEPEEAERGAPKSRGANPQPESKESGEGINVQIDGEAFPFPDYLANIQIQIGRYFRWTGRSGLSAEIYFVIRRDGTVEDIRILRGSGDFNFNLQAMAAVEQAGRRGAFGPLPEGFAGDRLPVAFYFEPAR